jgi:hypothetical protein
MIPSSILGYTEVKSPIIPDPITSPSATQSRGLLSTISGFLTRSPAAQTTSGPKDIPEPAGSPTPAIDPAKDNNDKMAATRKAVSKSAEPAEEDGEPEVAADEEDEDEDVPEEEYEVDKVLDHRQGPLVSLQAARRVHWILADCIDQIHMYVKAYARFQVDADC